MKKSKITCLLLLAFIMTSLFYSTDASASTKHNTTKLISTAKSNIGVPYIYGGMSRRGFDCSGFVKYTYTKNGVTLPRTASSMYSKLHKKVKKNQLKKGDLVFFNTSGRGVSHVGIYIGSNKFIHSMTGIGVTITNINDRWYWGNKYIGAKRV